jgi:hypothetical protein
VPIGDLRETLEPRRFVGRSAEQVDEFLDEIVEPLLAGTSAADVRDVAEVRV